MDRRKTLPFLALLLLAAAGALAQELSATPPPVLSISLEEIKPGSMGPHEKQAAAYMALFNRANVGAYRLGLVPISGDQNHVLYLEGYVSYADLEAINKKFEETLATNTAFQAELDQLDRQTGPMHTTQKTAIAVFRPDLSYRPVGMEAVAKSRYFTVTTTRLKPGRGADYEEYVKQLNRAREKANVDVHVAVYQVTSGAPFGTFVTFVAYRSLAELDEARRGAEARNKAIDEALGGEAVVKQRRQMAEAIFAEGGHSALYSFNPKISRPSPQFAAADPDFWMPKAPGKVPAAKKEVKK